MSIFYREAGRADAPTLLLLHGLPSSSRMFEPLFAYTFDHYAQIMQRFTEVLGLSRYTLYMQDYGGPVGFRMALAHPEHIESLIVQNAVAHNEGLGASWKDPKWQRWLRERQPRLLLLWGKYDASFELSEPEAYRRDVPGARIAVVDGGHFALDTAAEESAALIRGFVA